MRAQWLAVALLALLHVAAVANTAWVSDDAFITFRTIDNALSGHGLVWNLGERVQTYTHPLWMLLLWATSAATGSIYGTSLVLGALLTALALWLGVRAGEGSPSRVALLLGVLVASRAWIDYSTSGLENPLSHVLVGAVAVTALRRDAEGRLAPLRYALLAACLLTRLDLLFIAAPPLCFALYRDRGLRLAPAAMGLWPFALWEGFSLLYYGAPIANSALAKLNSGLGVAELVPQGLAYLGNSLRSDPVTLVVTAGGVVAAGVQGDGRARALALGALSMLVWVVSVGGDFMSGRFLTPPLFLGALLLARARMPEAVRWSLAIGVAAVGMLTPYLSPFAERDYGAEWHAAIDDRGIADERHFHLDSTSLRTVLATGGWESGQERARSRAAIEGWYRDPWIAALTSVGVLDEGKGWPPRSPADAAQLRPVLVKGGVGLLGYKLGRSVHILDYHGLGDPLLARLPAAEDDPVLELLIPRLAPLHWRVGHYLRRVPSGYARSLSADRNAITDPSLSKLLEDLRLVTRGPLFAPGRLAAVWRLNTR